MIKIVKGDEFLLNARKRYCYTFNVIDNNCPDIKVGDDIEIEGKISKVEELEWFMKSFGLKGDNVSILIS